MQRVMQEMCLQINLWFHYRFSYSIPDRARTSIGLAQREREGYEGRTQNNNLINNNKRSYLQVSDGLFSYQLLFLVPLHGAHYTGPQHADHGLFRDGVLLHLLFAVHNDLQKSTR